MTFVFHTIGKELTDSNKSLLQSVMTNHSSIEFHTITNEHDSKFILRDGDHITAETYYRFFITEFLPENTTVALYLDADILCTGSIENLFKTDISSFACGMVLDMDYSDINKYNRLNYSISEKYFNAGVMLINMDYWRNAQVTDCLLSFLTLNPNKCQLHDQDAINAVLHNKIKRLNFKYDLQNTLFRTSFWADENANEVYEDEKIEKEYWPEILKAIETPVFIHFTGPYKPWHKECNIPFANLWRTIYKAEPYSTKTIKPKKKNISQKIKFHALKFAVKHHFKKEMPFISKYPEYTYKIEQEFIDKLLVDIS